MARKRMPGSSLPYASGPIGSKKSPAQKKRDAARKAREFARKYGSEERCFYVSSALGCIVPGCYPRGYTENAHTATGGVGYKADAETVVSLCSRHHRTGADSLHNLGRESFEAAHGVDLEEAAAGTEVSWRLYGADVVERAKADGRYERWKNRRNAA